jgi:microtubule-associated protein-like 6
VTRVRFTYDDNYLISIGGLDKSIIVWKTTFGVQGADIKKGHEEMKNDCAEEGDDDVDVV